MLESGKDVKTRREALDWTQQRLADQIKVTTRTLQRWEEGDTMPDSMKILLQYVFEEAEKSETMSPLTQQIVYISKDEMSKKGLTEVIIRLV